MISLRYHIPQWYLDVSDCPYYFILRVHIFWPVLGASYDRSTLREVL
jgi:hypothetical protein